MTKPDLEQKLTKSAAEKLVAAAYETRRPNQNVFLPTEYERVVPLKTALAILGETEEKMQAVIEALASDLKKERAEVQERLAATREERDKYDLISIKLCQERDDLLEKAEAQESRWQQENEICARIVEGWNATDPQFAKLAQRIRNRRPDGEQESRWQHRSIVMEGQLNASMQQAIKPVMCDKNCDPAQSFLVAHVARKDGATSFYALERLLEHLNGREVRVTVDWNDLPAPPEPSEDERKIENKGETQYVKK